MNHHRTFKTLCASAAAAMLLWCACASKSESPVIARVGDAVLTVADLQRTLPAEYAGTITREQNITYVKQWFDTELLYQEALRRGLQREGTMRERLEKMKRDLLSTELISRLVAAPRNTPFSDDSITHYYEANKQTFVRQRDMVRFEQMVLDDCALAQRLRSTVTPRTFTAMTAQYSRGSAPVAGEMAYIAVDELPADIAQLLWSLRINGISAPVRTAAGCNLIHLLDKQTKGSICSLEEVRDEIIDRLSTQAQRREMDQVLKDLRLRMNCELNPDLIPITEPTVNDSMR